MELFFEKKTFYYKKVNKIGFCLRVYIEFYLIRLLLYHPIFFTL